MAALILAIRRDINRTLRDVSIQHEHLDRQIEQLEKNIRAALLARQVARAA